MADTMGRVEWTRDETFSLIKCVENFEFLWAIGRSNAGNRTVRDRAWKRIAAKFLDPGKQSTAALKAKWKELQCQYSAENAKSAQMLAIDGDAPRPATEGSPRVMWQYYDAMDLLYSKARQKLIDDRRKNEITPQPTICKAEMKNERYEDEAECTSDAASTRTLSYDSEQFEEASESTVDSVTQSAHIDSQHVRRPVLQRVTSTTGTDCEPNGQTGGKRKWQDDAESMLDTIPAKRRKIETAGTLIGQHVGSMLDSFGKFPDFQSQVIRQIQDVVTRASYDFFDLATVEGCAVESDECERLQEYGLDSDN